MPPGKPWCRTGGGATGGRGLDTGDLGARHLTDLLNDLVPDLIPQSGLVDELLDGRRTRQRLQLLRALGHRRVARAID
eukprot:3579755-Pyramimonas_sp.AAC.1